MVTPTKLPVPRPQPGDERNRKVIYTVPKQERRPVDERGVVRRPQTGTGPAKPAAPKPRVDRTKPGMPTGPVINKNKQAGSNLQKGSTGPLPFNPRRGGAGMTNQSKPKPAPKRMAPRRGLK